MKNLSLFAAVVAALILSSCKKDQELSHDIPTVTIQFQAIPGETKAAFGEKDGATYPVNWENGDVITITENYSSSNRQDNISVNGQISLTFAEKESYKFSALYPSSAYKGINSKEGYTAVIPNHQRSTPTSPDKSAIILGAFSEVNEKTPSSVALAFKHITAYLHMSFTHLEAGKTVKSVSVSMNSDGSGKDDFLADRISFKESGDTWTWDEVSMTKSLLIDTDSPDNVWCGVAPVDLRGKTLSFTVSYTDGYSYTKSATFPNDAKYQLSYGKIAKFNVNMQKEGSEAVLDELEEYELVTDVNSLQNGDIVIIVGKDQPYAMSTAQNDYNRGQYYVNIDGNKVINPGIGVERITLEKTGDNYYLKTGTGSYLYYNSTDSNNNLYSKDSNLGALWSISLTSSTFDIVNAERHLQYNKSNAIFSTYENNNTTSNRGPVNLYKKKSNSFSVNYSKNNIGAEEKPELKITSNVSWTATVSGSGAILSKTTGTGDETLTLTLEANNTLSIKDYTVTITPDPRSKIAPVTVTYHQYGRLWYEDWNGATNDGNPESYLTAERKADKVLGDGTNLTYQRYTPTTTDLTRTRTDGLVFVNSTSGHANSIDPSKGQVKENLLIAKNNGYFTANGIPCKGVKNARISYKSNTKLDDGGTSRNIVLSTSTAGVSVGTMSYTSKTNSYTYNGTNQSKTVIIVTAEITFGDSFNGDTFDLTLTNGYTSNIRATQFELIALEMN